MNGKSIEICGKEFIPTELNRPGSGLFFPQDSLTVVRTLYEKNVTVRAKISDIQTLEKIIWDQPPKKQCKDCPIGICAIGLMVARDFDRAFYPVGCGKVKGKPYRRLLVVPSVPSIKPLSIYPFSEFF